MRYLATLAASVSLAAIASPAYAQCVEGPPNNFTCSGTTSVSQVIASDDATVTADPNFEVDTSGNGNGVALQVTGAGLISFTGAPDLTGAGARFLSTGDSGLSPGGLFISSSGRISANGTNGLHLENAGTGNISALWGGAITNSGGNGIAAFGSAGSGELFLLVGRVNARDHGIGVEYSGNASAIVTAFMPVIAETGNGVQIGAGLASTDLELTVAEVTGGASGIVADGVGTGTVRIEASGTVTGLTSEAIWAYSGSNTLGLDIRTVEVNGALGGIVAHNMGNGDLSIVATGRVTGAGYDGIFASNLGAVGNVSITATDVIGERGIRTYNGGAGTTIVVATGDVVGFGGNGVDILAEGSASDLLVDVRNVEGNANGIEVDNQGTGNTFVQASGTVTGTTESGISVDGDVGSTGIRIRANQVSGNVAGIRADNQGSGDTAIVATGAVSGQGDGIFAVHGTSARDISITVTDVSGFYGIRTFNQGVGATSITATGLIDGADYGIIAQNVGGSTDMNIRAANVTANGTGIEVENFGSGTTNVVADTVIGLGDLGLRITTASSAGSVDLTVGNVTGGYGGVVVDNSGTGTTRVTATGTVTGAGSIGMNVINDTGATDLEIHANNVNGGSYFGMLALNQGTGDTLVETTGLVAAPGIWGLSALNETTARNLSVSTVDVIGGLGVSVGNSGAGRTDVVSTGTITGYSFDGMSAGNEGTATDLRVDVNVVNGDDRGMRIFNTGVGATSIRARGTVTGATSTGIDVAIGASAQGVSLDAVDVTGSSGIRIDNQGSGTTRVAATGTVTGVIGDGIEALANTLAGDVDIDVATVTGSTGGIDVVNFGTGSASITASGTISALAADGYGISVVGGTGSTDIRIEAEDVLGNARGIHTENYGSGETVIASSGQITGGNDFGLFARTSATDLTISANSVLGAEDGIATEHVGTGATRILAASATGTSGAGVRVQADGTAGAVDLTLGNATGATYGALVTNYGTSSTRVETTGAVTGTADAGIAIENGSGATGIALRAAQVAGGNYGIQVENLGAGNTSVVATGPVTATGMGMFVFNGATAANILVNAAGVQGAETGMLVVNQGSGTTSITAGGLVAGTNVAGIDARAGVTAQGLTVSAVAVTGASGITVQNFGQGSAGISAIGTVTALDAAGTGIAVVGGTGSIDLSVASAGVVGGARGIDTDNNGSGDTLILANGLVTGSEIGIRAHNGAGADDIGIRTVAVQSAGSGIIAKNLGTGDTTVRADGTVTAQGEAGIAVLTGAASGDVAVLAGTVSGGLAGIWVENDGIGTASITATGPVSGTAFGVHAAAGAGAGDVVIATANASGGTSGISATNLGLGDTSITVSGTVQGGTRGIEAFADGNQGVAIFNNGTVRNTSGLGSARAIGASGGGVGISNAGTLIGTVEIAGDLSLLINSGNWQSIGGTSNFATIDDTLFNSATGTLVGGILAATVETTGWQGLERFRNSGTLRLQDGGTGDLLQTSAATTFTAGSLLAVDIAGATAADLYRTSGTVTIEAGSRLNAVATQPLVLHGKHVIVQADGGLTGQFAFEDQLLTAFAGIRDGYTATTAYIEFAQMKAFAAAGLTPNQKETGAGADALPNGNALKDALLLLPNDAAAQDAFDQLSGEIHPSARGAMFDDARLVRNAVLDRLAGGAPGISAWARAFGATGMNDGDYNAARMQRDTKGGVIGLDASLGVATIGIAGGWSDSDLRIDRRTSNGSIETVHAMAYAGATLGSVRLRGGAGYAWTTTETRRRIAFQGFAAQPHARYQGSVLQAYGEAGYQLPLGGGHVEPFVNLTAVRASTDGFTETGGSPAALTGKAVREQRVASTLGLRLETPAAGPVSVRGSIGWNRAWGDLDPVGVHAFAGGAPFTILGAAGSRDSALGRFDAQMRLSTNVTLSIGYDGVLGSRGDDHSVTGGLRIVF